MFLAYTGTDTFATPDDLGPPTISELLRSEAVHRAVEVVHLLALAMALACAVIVFLTLRYAVQHGGWRLGRLLRLWLSAKERELSDRASKDR